MRVPSTELQNNFGRYLKFAEAGEEIIVTKNGRDAARLVRIDSSDFIGARACVSMPPEERMGEV